MATDLSPEAVELAADNLAAHGASDLVTVAVSDLLDPIGPIDPRADVVVANLPYVRSAEVATGAGSLAWEPVTALDGGPDGVDPIRGLLNRLPRRLADNGSVILEVGAGQADRVREMFGALPGSWSVSTVRDLGGHERIVRGERVA